MQRAQRAALVAAVLAFFILASLADALSTYAGCGAPNLFEANPFFDDPCEAFTWKAWLPAVAVFGLIAAVLAAVVLGSARPFCAPRYLLRFRPFWKQFWLPDRHRDKNFSAYRLTAVWGPLQIACYRVAAALHNAIVLSTGFHPLAALRNALDTLGIPPSIHALWVAVLLLVPITMSAAQWLTWKFLNWSERFAENAAAAD